jgi:hypothetical protein
VSNMAAFRFQGELPCELVGRVRACLREAIIIPACASDPPQRALR